MKTFSWTDPRFIKTAIYPKDYPKLFNASGKPLVEVAVAGRSNVGKSSLLNHLFRRKDLVKTSSTPGKTQALNFFTLNDELAFVDLPGYGYAQVPLSVRKQWGPMVHTYLEERETLRLILFLFDIRRLPGEEEFQLLEWIASRDKAMILVLTKVDKVSASQRKILTKKILDGFGVENMQYVYYSATKDIGRKELIRSVTEALHEEERYSQENPQEG